LLGRVSPRLPNVARPSEAASDQDGVALLDPKETASFREGLTVRGVERYAATSRPPPSRWLLVDGVDALAFPSEAGTVIDSSNLMQRVLKPAGRRAGVPWVGFHTFRHTCATMLFRSGANAVAVQKHMGHHSPAFTLSTYVHFLDDDLPSVDFLDDVTGGGNNLVISPTEIMSRAVGDEEVEFGLFAGETLSSLRSVGG
jgi:hypothetical protein